MKTISIMLPTYNEEENVELFYEALKKEFDNNLKYIIGGINEI